MKTLRSFPPLAAWLVFSLLQGTGRSAAETPQATWEKIAPFFTPPPQFANDFGHYRSPLEFYGGERVKTAADWQRRRQEILVRWQSMMGSWPPVINTPKVEILQTTRRENFFQNRIRFQWLPNEMTEGYLLIPDGQGARPAVLVVYYEPETAIGLGKEYRDFAYQLARRGFVTLSMGNRAGLDSKTYAIYYPSQENAAIQPLSALAYAAANACQVLANRKEVDPQRIGVMGHSFGGKWAMFASCLYEKFACAVWSDPGIVFDESRPSVNYWEPWYLGYEPGHWRTRGIITPTNPRTGLYKRLVAEGYDLVELHALMAPRPFLVSGGSEDQPRRWQALNHTVKVNELLGYHNRVAMTNRPEHSPNAESNEQIYRFFEHFLLPIRLERHQIDAFPAGYQAAVAELNGDGRPDVIALSTNADRVDWYENPSWKRHPVARTEKNIDLAVRDLDGDGKPEIALASGFYFNEASRGGQISLLRPPKQPDEVWRIEPIATDPVVHRLRWGDLDGDGKPELLHAPIFGPGSRATRDPKPSHLWAFRPPAVAGQGSWNPWKIDETLTVLHALYVGDLDGDGRDELLTASFEGIHRFDFEGTGPAATWRKLKIAAGAGPLDSTPGAARGSSEVAPGRLEPDRPYIAAIEPWHGHQVVVYTPPKAGGFWQRRVLDGSLQEGHALAVADFDQDGADEIIAGWRGGEGGLAYYDSQDDCFERFQKIVLDRGITVEGAVAVDLNLDRRPDLVAIAGKTNNLVWYENR